MSLGKLVKDLRTEIEKGLTSQDLGWLRLGGPPEPLRFAPLKLAKTVLRPQLSQLFRAISDDGKVDSDVSIANSQLEAFRILATLLCIECSRDALKRFREDIIRNHGSSISDKDLPITEEEASRHFGEFGQGFYHRQYDFCPVILKEHEVVECTGRATCLRLPFLSNEAIGEGSSGDVIKVEVPPGHFQFCEKSQGTNKTPEVFACKVFRTNDTTPYKQEFQILDFIRQSPKKHPNVMLERGSLLVRNTCILYFEVANGDLHNYFLKEPTIPQSKKKEISQFLWRFHGILDALAFLHEDLVKAENPSEVWRFAHLDLRPANILIFKASERYSREIWKIHDFGISKVKKATKGDEVIGWRKMFRSDTEDLTAPGTLRAQRSTTFLAPEYKNFTIGEMASVTYKADIWSFGCIMSVGLSFLIGGSESVKQFSQERKDQAGVEDVFFVSEERRRFRGAKVGININPAVSKYLGDVPSRIEKGEGGYLQPALQKIIEFLMKKTLAPVPKARVTGREGAERLRQILMNLDHSEDGPDKHNTKVKIWKKIKGEAAEPAEDPTQESKTFELILPEGSNFCKFSYCGKYLAYFSPNSIAFYETVSIFRGDYPPEGSKKVRLLKPPEESKWRGFDINSKYLVAYTDAKYFDCHIYSYLVQPDRDQLITPDHYSFTIRESGSIHFAALSPDPDSGFLATSLKSDDQRYHVYLSEVADMIKSQGNSNGVANMISTATTSSNLTPSHRTHQTPSTSTLRSETVARLSQTASSRSSDFQSRLQPPWKSSMLHSAEVGEKSELTHIHSMQFSANSKIFTVLSQPPKANKLAWYCWDTTPTNRARVRIGKFTRKLEAKTDTHQLWMTAFIPLMPDPSVMFITQQTTILRRAFSDRDKSVDWSTQRLKTPLFHILPFNNEKDKHFIFIGRKGGAVKALYAPISKNKSYEKAEKLHFDFILDLECQEWVVGRDAAAYLEDGMEFLIARPSEGTRGFARKIYRPRAPRPAKHK